MAITRKYTVDPLLAGPLEAGAGAGELAIDRERRLAAIAQWQEELAQRRAIADQETQYRYDTNAQNANLDYTALGQRNQQFYDEMGNRNAQFGAELQGRLIGDQIQQQGFAQRQANQSAAQLAQSLQDKRMQLAISEHDALTKAWQDGDTFTDDAQFQEAIRTWEGRHGMQWGLPEQLANEQMQQQQAMQGDALYAAFTNPLSGEPYFDRNSFETIVGPLDPKGRADLKVKMDAEARQQKALEIKGADLERDDQAHVAEQQKKWESHDATMTQQKEQFAARQAQQEQQFKQKMAVERANAITKFKADVAKQKANRAMMEAAAKAQEQESDGPAVAMPPAPDWDSIEAQGVADIEAAYSTTTDSAQVRSFATEEEAAAANLEPGTPIKINGRDAVWE